MSNVVQLRPTPEPATGEDGLSSFEMMALAGITYRQAVYWDATGLLVPSGQQADGSGTRRAYTLGDVRRARLIRRLADAGLGIRRAAEIARQVEAQETIFGDGVGAVEIAPGVDLIVRPEPER